MTARNKDRWDLLPLKPLRLAVKVLSHGEGKHPHDKWKTQTSDQHYASLMRHLSDWRDGRIRDGESGQNPLAHAMCRLMFLVWLEVKP